MSLSPDEGYFALSPDCSRRSNGRAPFMAVQRDLTSNISSTIRTQNFSGVRNNAEDEFSSFRATSLHAVNPSLPTQSPHRRHNLSLEEKIEDLERAMERMSSRIGGKVCLEPSCATSHLKKAVDKYEALLASRAHPQAPPVVDVCPFVLPSSFSSFRSETESVVEAPRESPHHVSPPPQQHEEMLDDDVRSLTTSFHDDCDRLLGIAAVPESTQPESRRALSEIQGKSHVAVTSRVRPSMPVRAPRPKRGVKFQAPFIAGRAEGHSSHSLTVNAQEVLALLKRNYPLLYVSALEIFSSSGSSHLIKEVVSIIDRQISYLKSKLDNTRRDRDEAVTNVEKEVKMSIMEQLHTQLADMEFARKRISDEGIKMLCARPMSRVQQLRLLQDAFSD